MANGERSSLESEKALDKVESALGEACRLYDDGQDLDKAEGDAVAAREACGQMAQYMCDSLLPLVNEAVKAIENRRPAGQVDVQVDTALTQVNNLRPTLGGV